MGYKVCLFIIFLLVGCSKNSANTKKKLLKELNKELFDIQYSYNGYQQNSEIAGRLKNTLNCTVKSLTFEVYLHKAVRDSTIPDKKSYTPEELMRRYKPGKVLDQEKIRITTNIEPNETKSFIGQNLSSMIVKNYYPPEVKLTDFSTYDSYSSCLDNE